MIRKPDVRFSDFWEVVRLPNTPDFRSASENRTLYPVFGSSGPFTLQRPDFECPVPNRPKPVPNRFVDTIARTFEIRTILSGFRTSGLYITSDNRTLCPDFRRRQLPERPITRQDCPDFECPNQFGHSKSGRLVVNRTSEIRTIR